MTFPRSLTAAGGLAALLLALGCSGEGEPPASEGGPWPEIRFTATVLGTPGTPPPDASEEALAAFALPAADERAAPIVLERDRRLAVRLQPGGVATLAPVGGERPDSAPRTVRFEARLVGAAEGAEEPLTAGGETLSVAGTWRTFTVEAADGLGALEVARGAGGQGGAALLLSAPRVVDLTASPPTVLLITSDTHRADHVSTINPGSPVSTPHIDRLGDEGAVFTNCFSSINNTNPSHVALLTGVHPRDTKIINNHTRLHVSADTLAERFRAAGYQTHAALSAFHLFDDVSGLGQGFDRMSAPLRGAHDGRVTLALAGRWLEEAEGAPLFLWVHLFDAHTPYELPDEQMSALLEGRPDPYRAEADLGLSPHRVPGWLESSELRDPEFVTALYAGEVRYLDGLLGDFLARPRIAAATIAFTADHGEALGEQDIWWDHFGLVDPTIHVPLVLRGPGVPPRSRTAAPVRQMDVARTLLLMAGVDDGSFPGRDVRAVIADPPPPEPRFAMSGQGISASVEVEGWLLELYLRDVVNSDSAPDHFIGEVSLFDLASDPRCTTNRLLDEFDRARRMRAALIQWLGAARSTGMTYENQEVSPAVQAKLAELGYTGGLESIYKWWTPERRDAGWPTNPWHLAFEGDGAPELLRERIRTGSGDR